jgi:5-methylcytosine-specific restriction enzyme subunit McrC
MQLRYQQIFIRTSSSASKTKRYLPDNNNILKWAETFLLNNSFTNFVGTTLNVAVLFPMEKVFEGYVTFLFSKYADGFKIRAQDRSYFLVEKHIDGGKFQLRPDLFIKRETVKEIIIDTKWKLIDELAPNKNL